MLELLKNCLICPRNCGVNRIEGTVGYCQAGANVRIARAALHHWEEPCLSGTRGSGTVFFSYCNLRCIYCQNHQISQSHQGKEVTLPRLSEIFMELQDQGAHNINLVTPTHYVPQIIEALDLAKKNGLSIPIVYNTSGYEKRETIQLLKGYIDVYLPDMKYFNEKYAMDYSHASDYFRQAAEAIDEMVKQVGQPIFSEDGMMQKGVIIRHLLLPGHLADSKKVVKYLHNAFGHQVFLSLMNQYTPLRKFQDYPQLNHKVQAKNYDSLVDYALDLGVENGFIQEGDTAEESFIPPFDGEGI